MDVKNILTTEGQQISWIRIISHRWSMKLWCLFSALAYVCADATATVKLLSINERGTIASKNFPFSCCEAQTITLIYESPPGAKGYIHLSFNDIDLPVGTYFRLFNNETESLTSMYRDQPDYKHRGWKRPFISSESSPAVIHLVLRPVPYSQLNATNYVGFNASYVVSKSEKSYYQTTSDLCRPALSAVEGSAIKVKPQPTRSYSNKMLDCVWVIKIAPEDESLYPGYLPYIRIDSLHIGSKGYFEIREGIASIGTLNASGKVLEDLNQPPGGFVGREGFYVRTLLPADNRQNKVQFVYGVLREPSLNPTDATVDECPAKGFVCSNDWCLPETHVCNKVKNCPDGHDENDCLVTMATSTTTATTTTTTTTIATTTLAVPSTTKKRYCSSYYTVCSDGRCVMYSFHCDDNPNIGRDPCGPMDKYCEQDGSCVLYFDPCPGECSYNEKRCKSGYCVSISRRCAEDPCPSYDPLQCNNNQDCYSESDKCDDYNDCSDGTDEEDCGFFNNDGKNHLYVLMVIPILISLIVCCIKCIQPKSSTSDNQGETTSTRARVAGTQLQPVTRTTANPSSPQYTTIPNNDTAAPAPPSGEDVAPLPPSYDEVTAANNFSPNLREPAPPTYQECIERENIV